MIGEAHLTLNYYYDGVYAVADGRQFAASARPGRRCSPRAPATAAGRPRASPSTADPRARTVGRAQAGLGGWDLDVHHVYDALGGNVLLGDGTVRRGGEVPGGPAHRRPGPAGRAAPAAAGSGDFDVLPDGSVVFAGGTTGIYRSANGVAPRRGLQFGDPFQPARCDGGPATTATSGTSGRRRAPGRPRARGPRAVLRLRGPGPRICEMTTDGRLVRLAGAATNACPAGVDDCRGDGGPALDAPIGRTDHVRRPTGRSTSSRTRRRPTGTRLIRRIDPAG